MRNETGRGFNFSLILAACIVAAGLIVAAVIIHARPGNPPPNIVQSQAAPIPSEASVRQQFISQYQVQLTGHSVKIMGKEQPVQSVEVSKVQFAAPGDEIDVVYVVHGKTASMGTGCTLRKNAYGHFVSTDDVIILGDENPQLHPHVSIQ